MPEADLLEFGQSKAGTGGTAILKSYVQAASSGVAKAQSIEAALRNWALSADAAYRLYETAFSLVGTPSLLTGLFGAAGYTGLPVVAALTGKRPRAALNGFEQYTIANWDGDDAVPLSKSDLEYARSLLDALELYTPAEPDAAPGKDGSVCMEWVRETGKGTSKLFVDVAPNDQVLVYLKCSGLTSAERHFHKLDTDLLSYLQTAFLMFSVS
jgi:hypothetical protein